MADPFSAIPGVEIVVGATTASSVKINVVSLRAGTITVDAPGNVSIGAWTELGADNSAESGKYVCAAAVVTITGLRSGSLHRGSITCDGVTHEFSFRTWPTDGSPWSFLYYGCERLSDEQYADSAPWKAIRQEIEDSSRPPVLFICNQDDPCYADLVDELTDTSGLAITSGGPAFDSELEWDYTIGWLAWYGLLRTPDYAGNGRGPSQSLSPARLWTRHHCAHFVQWGDNEVMPNHGRDANPTSPARKIPRSDPWWPKALKVYRAMCGNACHAPYWRENGCHGFGVSIGNLSLAVPDINHAILPYNAADSGDTHEYGRAGHSNNGTASGATTPTRTQVGRGSYPWAPPYFFGIEQCDDIIDFFGNAGAPLNVLATPNGIEWRNEPWHSRWPDEFDYLFAREREFIVDGDFMDGADHWTAASGATLGAEHTDRTQNHILTVTNDATGFGEARQEVTGLTPGETYTVQATKVAGAGRLRVGTTAGGSDLANINTSAGVNVAYSGTFTAPANGTVYITLQTQSGNDGDVSKWDKVSLHGPGRNYGLLKNPGLYGDTGCLVIAKGDTHVAMVSKCEANGANGLCDTALPDGRRVYEICSGTVCGSGSHNNFTNASIQNGTMTLIYQQYVPGNDPPAGTGSGEVATYTRYTAGADALLAQMWVGEYAGQRGARTPQQGYAWTGRFRPDGGNAPDVIPASFA